MAEQIFIIEDGTLTKYEADDYVEVVYIPDCVKRIGCQAFFKAVVGKVVIPDSVTTIEADAESNFVEKEEPVSVKENSDPAVKSGDGVTIRQLDELVNSFLGTDKAVSQEEAIKNGEEFYDDAPEDAKKRANGDLVRVGGFDIEHGLLRGYYGSDKDITLPYAARIITSSSFERCRLFVESINLKNAGKIIAGRFGAFSNCPNLKTVGIPETVKEVTPDMFYNCPNLTVYVRRSQVSADFEERFTGKDIIYLDE